MEVLFWLTKQRTSNESHGNTRLIKLQNPEEEADMSNKAQATEAQRCKICNTPTANLPYQGMVLCSECIEAIDSDLEYHLEASQEPVYDDLDY